MNEIKSLHDLPGGSDPAGVIAHSVLDFVVKGIENGRKVSANTLDSILYDAARRHGKPRLAAKVRRTQEYRAARWLAS